MPLVAVYGTLKRTYSNHESYLAGCPLIANIRVPAMMLSLRYFPGIILHKDVEEFEFLKKFCSAYATNAEVYSVSDKNIESLDRLEGHPSFYERKIIKNDALGDLWIYTLHPHKYLKGRQLLVAHGIWSGQSTTVQNVDFFDGLAKPKVIGYSSIEKPIETLPPSNDPHPNAHYYEDWEDCDGDVMWGCGVNRNLHSVEEEPEEYEITEIELEDDDDQVKEAV